MTKKEYLSQLGDYLAALSIDERQEIMAEIEERFQAASEKGEKSAQVIDKLGTPEFLAQSYLKTAGKEGALETVKPKSGTRTLSKIILAITLLALNFFFVLWLWFGVFMGILAFLIGGGSILLVGLTVMLTPAIGAFFPHIIIPNIPSLLYFMVGLTVILFAVLCILLIVWFMAWLIKMFVKYVKYNIKLVQKV